MTSLAWHCPFAFLEHGIHSFYDTRVRLADIFSLIKYGQFCMNGRRRHTHGQLVKWTGILNISQSLLECPELRINLLFGLLSRSNLNNS